MPVRRVIKGDGIGATARTEIDLTGPLTQQDAQAVQAMLTAAARRSSFEGLIEPVERWAQAHQRSADATLAGLARDITRLLAETRLQIQTGNAEAAAWAAAKLGAAATTAQVRLEWNDDAQRGRGVRLGGAKRSAETRRAKEERDRRIVADYRAEAARFHLDTVPHGWRGEVERRLAGRYQLSAKTVRSIISAAERT